MGLAYRSQRYWSNATYRGKKLKDSPDNFDAKEAGGFLGKMTRTKETEREYRRRFMGICKKYKLLAFDEYDEYRRFYSSNGEVSMSAFPELSELLVNLESNIASDLEVARHTKSNSYFKKLKACIVFCLNEAGASPQFIEKIKSIKYTKENMESYLQRKKNGAVGKSAYKSKGIKEKDLDYIISRLRSGFTMEDAQKFELYAYNLEGGKMSWAVYSFLYFNVNRHLGLRIEELHGLKIVERYNIFSIYVKNAKSTNMRSHGEYRSITIDKAEFDAENPAENGDKYSDKFFDRLEVLRLATDRYGSEFGKERFYQNFHRGFASLKSKLMPRLQERKRSITLYSVRHHFISAARKAGLSRVEIAALVGHASDLTASRHYGGIPAKKSGSAVGVKPSDSDVAKVRLVYAKSKGLTKAPKQTPKPSM